MHELSATQAALEVTLDAARKAGAPRVISIELVVGGLVGVVEESVRFYFDLLSQGTPAEGAALQFRHEPATAQCADCGHSEPVKPPLPHTCKNCGSMELKVSGGMEFFVAGIEVPDPEIAPDSKGEEQTGSS